MALRVARTAIRWKESFNISREQRVVSITVPHILQLGMHALLSNMVQCLGWSTALQPSHFPFFGLLSRVHAWKGDNEDGQYSMVDGVRSFRCKRKADSVCE